MTRRIALATIAGLMLSNSVVAQVATTRTPFDAPERVDLATPTVTVPLTKDGDYYYAAVRVNGRPARFTVETGANFIGISGATARALALPLDTGTLTGPLGQTQRVEVVRIDSITIGGATYRNLVARISPMFDQMGIQGIISVPYFQGLLASLELSKSRLVLARGSLPEPNGRDVIPMARRDRGGRIDFDMSFGATTLPVVIDTRSYLPLMLPDSLSSGIATEAPPRAMGNAAGPQMGIFQLRGARLAGPSRIGAVTFARPPIAFRDRPGAVIGVPMLEKIDLTFDLANNRLRISSVAGDPILMPPQDWESSRGVAGAQRTMGFNLAGFPGTPALRVVNLVSGSDAERAGLRNEDVLIEFDGTPVERMNPGIFRAAVARDTPTKIIIQRGSERLTFSIKPHIVP